MEFLELVHPRESNYLHSCARVTGRTVRRPLRLIDIYPAKGSGTSQAHCLLQLLTRQVLGKNTSIMDNVGIYGTTTSPQLTSSSHSNHIVWVQGRENTAFNRCLKINIVNAGAESNPILVYDNSIQVGSAASFSGHMIMGY